MRLWDVNDEGKKQRYVLKPRSQQGRRVIPTACAYSQDGRWVVSACQDGSIQIWDHTKSFVSAWFAVKLVSHGIYCIMENFSIIQFLRNHSKT